MSPPASAGERADVGVTHLLHRVGGEGRAISARAVDDDLGIARDDRFDLRLEIAARDVHRVGNLAEVDLLLVADVEKGDAATLMQCERFGRVDLANARLRFVDQVGATLHLVLQLSCVVSSESDVQRAVVGVELGHRTDRNCPLIVDVADRCTGHRRHSREIRRFAEYV
jgi:hypothetical protein